MQRRGEDEGGGGELALTLGGGGGGGTCWYEAGVSVLLQCLTSGSIEPHLLRTRVRCPIVFIPQRINITRQFLDPQEQRGNMWIFHFRERGGWRKVAFRIRTNRTRTRLPEQCIL